MLGRLKRHKTTIWGEVHPIFLLERHDLFIWLYFDMNRSIDTNGKKQVWNWELVDELSYLKIIR